MSDRLAEGIRKVVADGNCSGCGACSAMFERVDMRYSQGFLRPEVLDDMQDQNMTDSLRIFKKVCPGVRVSVETATGAHFDPTFGPYLEAWRARAVDVEIRRAGSSAGVLTALSAWAVKDRPGSTVAAASGGATAPLRTVPVAITTREEALAAAGSRYAPVASVTSDALTADVFVGKPCEVSALSAIERDTGGPLTLSFFCAGVPSQQATERLVEGLGHELGDVHKLRYRGDGCPGDFVVTSSRGESRVSYEESWGRHLGPYLQARCKVCPDGTGWSADLAVGDVWRSDTDGYPVFEEGEASSVVLVRSERGRRFLQRAVAEGIVEIGSIKLSEVAAVQPLQRKRRQTVLGRILGRVLAGKTVPKFVGFRLFRSATFLPSARATAGAFVRAMKE